MSTIMKAVWAVIRYGGYIIALPGNIMWHFGYCRANDYVGGRVEIVGAGPAFMPPPPATAPITPSVTAVIAATPA